MKDYHDILLMSREANLLDVIKLKNAIIVTFTNRETKLIFPIKFDDTGLNTLQKFWNNHLRSLGQYKNELTIPDKIDSLINEINQWLLSKKIFSN